MAQLHRDMFGICYKVKHIPILWPSNLTPNHFPKRKKWNIDVQKKKLPKSLIEEYIF